MLERPFLMITGALLLPKLKAFHPAKREGLTRTGVELIDAGSWPNSKCLDLDQEEGEQ